MFLSSDFWQLILVSLPSAKKKPAALASHGNASYSAALQFRRDSIVALS
jgi:hypothetical protein